MSLSSSSSSVARAPRRSKLIEVPQGIINGLIDDTDLDENEEAMSQAIEYVEEHLMEWDLKNGDIVQFLDACDGYRNCGKLIWFNNACRALDCEEYDTYGYIPSDITINQFKRADFFKKTIEHNMYIWHDHANYPVVRTTELPATASDDYSDLRLIEFKKGWSLITNCENILDRPYECNSPNDTDPINLPPQY
jgi:hypothetical protein